MHEAWFQVLLARDLATGRGSFPSNRLSSSEVWGRQGVVHTPAILETYCDFATARGFLSHELRWNPEVRAREALHLD